MSEIALRNVCKQFDSEHYGIKDFNLDIHDKEFVIFVGPSGCGKSTTLRIIAGLEEITDGELWIDGELSNYLEPKERGISMVFQNYALYPNMTVYGNMAYALKIRKMPKDEIDKNTYTIFDLERGVPTYAYELDEAVKEGYLVDYRTREYKTKIMEEGIHYDQLSEEEKEAFDDVYNEFVASLSSRLNTDLWDGIELTTDGSIQTNSFFAVFEKYCGEI